jgi:CRISPR-associated exonuclease Cas4
MDTLGSASPGPTLYDPVLDLAGRPDYVVERNRNRIPVEVKSGNALAGPRRSHRLQLIAYCRLVEAVHARRPPHGILRYRDRAFQIPYSAEAEAELRGLLQEMRADRPSAPDRSHDSPARCRRCTFLGTCDQALGEIEKTRPL